MYNWSTDTKKLAKHKDEHAIWKLEQQINFGLNGEKINKKNLVKNWQKLDLDPNKKNFLQFLIWKKRS
ncbi:hypothetical protein HZA40_02015 [Candidatus Peregrinibacteria bacterium]|nr:hypothetical protein [Candidatus Peregrinibacteria bacterium]